MQAEILGRLMMHNDSYEPLAYVGFKDQRDRIIADAIDRLHDADQPFDVITLAAQLEEEGTLEEAGGLGHLMELIDEFERNNPEDDVWRRMIW